VFPIEAVKNCLKRVTRRFLESKRETDAHTDRVRKKGGTDTDKSDAGRQLKLEVK
jgi:hypothetical protein